MLYFSFEVSVNMTRYILYSVSGKVHDRCYVIWSFVIHLKVSLGNMKSTKTYN